MESVFRGAWAMVRRVISPGLVVAVVAVCFAIVGTSYALVGHPSRRAHHRAIAGHAASTVGSILFGSVEFIDASQTSAFVGLGGAANPAPGAGAGGNAVLPVAGTLSEFNVSAVPSTTSGTLTFTVERNGVPTALTCKIALGSPALATRACVDSTHSVAFAAQQRITVLVSNPTGAYVKYVQWTAQYQ